MTFDLNALVPDDSPITVQLKHPSTGELLDGTTITLISPYSKAYKELMYDKAQEQIDNKEDTDKTNIRQAMKGQIDFFSSLTLKWELTMGGKQLKFTKSKAKELYEKLDWIIPQLDKALQDHEAFTRA
jgi:hypothetical protein